MINNLITTYDRNIRKLGMLFLIALAMLLAIGLGGCRSHKKSVKVDNNTVVIDQTVPIALSGMRGKLVKESLTWIGTPYRYGGSDKKKGTDCSGMVLRVYEDVAGIKLPRTSARQSEHCDAIREAKARPGDLVFFATGKDPGKVSHVGILIDRNRFVHSSSKKGVIVSDLTTPYYRRTLLKIGKVPEIK